MGKRIISGLLVMMLFFQIVSVPAYAKDNIVVEDEVATVIEEIAEVEDENETCTVSENIIQEEVAETDRVVASGTCTDSVFWRLTGEEADLTLTISGSGKIPD